MKKKVMYFIKIQLLMNNRLITIKKRRYTAAVV